MDTGKKINQLRTAQKMTLEDLGNKVNVGKSTVRKWETGQIANMKRDKLIAVAEALGTTPSYLMGWREDFIIGDTIIECKKAPNCPISKALKIPVLGNVAAGLPVEAVEDIIDYEEITEELSKTGEFFALRINGDSMEPKFSIGDVVIVKKQEDAESEDIVIVSINGNDATCKRLKKYQDSLMLISSNPKYEPMVYTNKEIKEKQISILGKVVELRAKF